MEETTKKQFSSEGEKQAKRIQTSILNGVEHKACVWMAERMPRWVTSDMLSFVGLIGALVIAAGYMLSNLNINWLWLSSLGFVIHWFGDSMDGNLARVRKTQRPIYGFYLDHTLDVITELIMFAGAGLSNLLRMDIALFVFIAYLMMTLNVTINSHLKSEFKLTYAKLGPTEFRVIMIIINTLLIYIPAIRECNVAWDICGRSLALGGLDIIAIGILTILMVMYIVTVIQDLRGYAKIDPLPKRPK
ncbi:MAG: CDP-alcohol phosphatidyltransferase family protein [Paludibacteraceae bacterium]